MPERRCRILLSMVKNISINKILLVISFTILPLSGVAFKHFEPSRALFTSIQAATAQISFDDTARLHWSSLRGRDIFKHASLFGGSGSFGTVDGFENHQTVTTTFIEVKTVLGWVDVPLQISRGNEIVFSQSPEKFLKDWRSGSVKDLLALMFVLLLLCSISLSILKYRTDNE